MWALYRAMASRDELDGSPAVTNDNVVPVVQHHNNEIRPASSNVGVVAQNNGVGEGEEDRDLFHVRAKLPGVQNNHLVIIREVSYTFVI
jgi:hypothetical protein